MTTVGIVIGTFGSDEWNDRGDQKKEACRTLLGVDNIIHVHGDNLARARNIGARNIGTDYIVFLDADDMLCYNYCDILKKNILLGQNILYQPQTIGWFEKTGAFVGAPEFIPDRNMSVSNNLVIGTAVPTSFCIEFDPVLPALEDWDFFLRMILNGAKVKQCPGMVYFVGLNENSRNSPTSGNHDTAYQIIRRKNLNVSNYILEP
ncbi:glycosyltransferase family 2 protein [Candidatus Saccharibacteria bacterium]|nr:MAG: glycosyltransferase family 2 protein [Candidatus Saccharibacteria bacterium]